MKTAADQATGLIDALVRSWAAALRTPEGTADPVALLWTDAENQWIELLPKLRESMPGLYTLGSYDSGSRTGPVIWLKCVVDRSIPEASPPPGTTPVLYLPGVSRQVLRAGEDCLAEMQPLIELQFRGRVWHQANGRDWSVEAFLVSSDGLALDIAQDARTREAMLRALPLLAETPLDALRGRRLEAEDFDKLAVSDPIRDLLRWLNDPDAFEKAAKAGAWESFRNICRTEFGVDPDKDGTSVAAEALANGGGRWDDAWQRYMEAPALYPGVPDVLRGCSKGKKKLPFFQPSRLPAYNEQQEEDLRRELEKAYQLPQTEACKKVLELEAKHRERREWVWARLGMSPYATALGSLARLASLANSFGGGASVEAMAEAYATGGWRCDLAAIQAVAAGGDRPTITKLVRTLYEPWLNASSRCLQDLVSNQEGKGQKTQASSDSERDTCFVFADGLRFELGARLKERLEADGFRASLTYRISSLPTVTATAKPLATPVAEQIGKADDAETFTPLVTETGQPATTQALRQEMIRKGLAVLDSEETGTPEQYETGAWTEVGQIDSLGHKLGLSLVHQLDAQLDRIAARVKALLESGWPKVRVVTDHGWLLLPGGFPKVELPAFLVATRWARCAAVRGDSKPNIPTYAWHWNPFIRVACPPGIATFSKGYEYAHGGISLQECVVPQLVVEREAPAVKARISAVTWRGMRCRIAVESNAGNLLVDLRTNAKLAATSIVSAPKQVGPEGEASLVTDDSHEGKAATAVVLDSAGNVLDKQTTIVGEAS